MLEAKGGVAGERPIPNELRQAIHAWDGLLEGLPVAVYVCDARGAIVQYNQRAAELWGRAPVLGDTTERFCGSYKLYFDGYLTSRDDTPMARVLATGEQIHGVEGVLERPDGSRIWAMVHIDPIKDANGKLIGAINCFHETTAQKRSEEQLREQEQRLAATYEHATIGITEVGSDGVRLRVNEAACQILGLPREKMVGVSIFESHYREEVDRAQAQFRELVEGKADRYSAERRLLRSDGKQVWLSVVSSAVRDRRGKFLYAVSVLDDITERKLAAEALSESQQRLAATYEQVTIGISEADADGNFLRVNEASCALTGFSREELLKRGPFFHSMRPEDAKAERDLYRRQVEGEIDRYTIEKAIRRKDGREIYVSVISSTVRDADGKFRYAVRVVQDITERKRAEERLRASERRLRELLEGLPAAIYTTDAEGRVTFFNQAAVDFSGRVPKLGTDEWCVTWKLYWPDGTPMAHEDCPMAVALREQRTIRDAEAIAERPDGTRVPFIPYPTPLFDEDGKLVGAINMLVDITDRKKAELRQRTLIDELNHRVKNTLATVLSLARQTARTAASPKLFQERLQGRLIALSEGHDQLTRGSWERADLGEVLEAALSPYRDDASDRILVEGEPVELHPRSALNLTMVFHELITNAAKYGSLSEAGGKLAIHWHVDQVPEGRILKLVWQESGGPKVEAPVRRGFGTKMVERSVPAELGGTANVEFREEGLRCELTIPLVKAGERSQSKSQRGAGSRRRG
jgi:PAS domain S-box-containing protein